MPTRLISVPVAFIALVSLTLSAASQAPAIPPLQRASQLIGTGKAAEAIPMLDSITTASPTLPQGWVLLGAALLSTRQLDRSITALQRAISLPGIRPAALYNLGLAYGLSGRMDSAFARLRDARNTGKVDMTQLGNDPDAGPIRADPRFATLLPTAAEFAAPFVESIRILYEWRGTSPGDQFGWVARDVGDVSGDKRHDIVTSTPSVSGSAGAVQLLVPGKIEPLWTAKGTAGDRLGTTVEAAGDVNGDGVPDVIAGAPGGEYAVLLSGKDGALIRRLNSRQSGELFGSSVSDLGDVDGDHYADVLVGAPGSDVGGLDAGRTYLISGRTGENILVIDGHIAGERFGSAVAGQVRGKTILIVAGAPGPGGQGRTYVYRGLSIVPAFVINSDSTGAQLGSMFISVAGDLDADGTPDIYASDWPNTAKGPATGRVYLYSGATGKQLYSLTGESAGGGFGIGVADAGDIDRDGADDLIIGAWQFAGAAASGGKVYLHSGRDGKLLGELTGRVMGETLGFDATGIGDVDKDGVPDLLLTSAWSGINGTRSGRVYVVSGADMLRTVTAGKKGTAN